MHNIPQIVTGLSPSSWQQLVEEQKMAALLWQLHIINTAAAVTEISNSLGGVSKGLKYIAMFWDRHFGTKT